MRSKLTHIPPLVEAKAPPKLVPPENEVTAIWRSLHAFKMTETSDVDLGKNTVTGVSSEDAGECGVLALESRIAGSVECSMWCLLTSATRLSMLCCDVLK